MRALDPAGARSSAIRGWLRNGVAGRPSKPECWWLTGSCAPCIMRGQNGLVRVVVTRIDPDGTVHRRTVDTAQQSERQLWEDLAARAVGGPVPYRPAPGIAVYHISVDDDVVIAAEHDLIGPLRDLVTAVMALGGELLERVFRKPLRHAFPGIIWTAVTAW